MGKNVTSGTREWADYNVNCIKGCYNDCRYCYAKMIAKRFRRSTEETWRNMEIRRDVLAKTLPKRSGRVMFPSSHDIFDTSPFKEASLTVLGALLKNGNNVLITTKPRLSVIREIDDRFRHHASHMQFRFTITSANNTLLAFWEPNAPKYEERMASLKYAFERGYRTSVSVEPFLDYDPTSLVETVMPLARESIWLGRMNYIPRKGLSPEEQPYYDEVRRNYDTNHLLDIYHRLRTVPRVRFKDSIRIQLGQAAENSRQSELSATR